LHHYIGASFKSSGTPECSLPSGHLEMHRGCFIRHISDCSWGMAAFWRQRANQMHWAQSSPREASSRPPQMTGSPPGPGSGDITFYPGNSPKRSAIRHPIRMSDQKRMQCASDRTVRKTGNAGTGRLIHTSAWAPNPGENGTVHESV
jgi:hypothetical protein